MTGQVSIPDSHAPSAGSVTALKMAWVQVALTAHSVQCAEEGAGGHVGGRGEHPGMCRSE